MNIYICMYTFMSYIYKHEYILQGRRWWRCTVTRRPCHVGGGIKPPFIHMYCIYIYIYIYIIWIYIYVCIYVYICIYM